ncbi:MAG: translation initiation factor IF-2, partial [Longicatena sp.]
MARQQRRGNNNRKGNNNHNKNANFAVKEDRVVVKEMVYYGPLSVGELAEKINRNASEIIKLLFMMGN